MKYIPISNANECAIVDDEDYEYLSLHNWQLSSGYAQSNSVGFMHMYVCNFHNRGKLVHNHKNENRLDNRRSNLELVTMSLNNFLSSSWLRQCRFDPKTQTFHPEIKYKYKTTYLGSWWHEAHAKQVLAEARLYVEELHRIDTYIELENIVCQELK